MRGSSLCLVCRRLGHDPGMSSVAGVWVVSRENLQGVDVSRVGPGEYLVSGWCVRQMLPGRRWLAVRSVGGERRWFGSFRAAKDWIRADLCRR